MKPGNFRCGDALHCQCLTFQISTESRKAFPRYELSKIGLVSLFFFFLSFHLGMKVTIKWKKNRLSDCLEIWYTKRWCKGASWYQAWLEYDKHSESYLRLFTKNNTNMLSRPQGKPQEAKNWFRGR